MLSRLRSIRPLLPVLFVLFLLSPSARASEPWIDQLGGVAVQDGGRVMPLDAYARRMASEVTGRQKWSKGRGPESYSGKHPVEFFCDVGFGGQDAVRKPLIGIENKPFKKAVGLDPERQFFSAVEIASCKGINDLLMEKDRIQMTDAKAPASKNQRRAMDLFAAANRLASLAGGEPLPIVPSGDGKTYRTAGMAGGDPGTEAVQAAWKALGAAYATGGSARESAVAELRRAIDATGQIGPRDARAVKLEQFYMSHNPWRMTQMFYGLAIVVFGLSRLFLKKPMVILALVLTALGVIEHVMGVGLRVTILDRAPVSNTFEALLWMGLVGIGLGGAAQALNRKGYYLFGGVCAAFASVLFAGLVPLTDRTNSLPAVLRSNYWLIIHVLTIVASYGVLLVAAMIGHVYLAKEVLFARRDRFVATFEAGNRLSHPLIAQTYRTIQVGLLLLTAGTILGGVWAADSWGRFWGWDPKETWALISIVVYFAVLHARYVRWLKDFGLAASAVLGFVVIVWTFYGVNYIMASGLHSYGFGNGGEMWVALWAAAEMVFLVACRVRYLALLKHVGIGGEPAAATAAPAVTGKGGRAATT
jgi:cytochrome c-type biogenesis protein CcsB